MEEKGLERLKKHEGKKIEDFECIRVISKKEVVIKCVKCGNEKKITLNGYKKGVSHKQCGKDLKMNGTRFYSIWANMRTRTTNEKYEKWHRYGGRGISSESFKYFSDFYKEMYDSYLEACKTNKEENITLERVDNNGDYRKENCRWATWDEQSKNKSNFIKFEVDYGNKKIEYHENLKYFCDTKGVDYNNVLTNLHRKKIGEKYKNKKTGWVFTRKS